MGPSAKPTKFMTIETWSVTKKSTMGKSIDTHSSQNPGSEGPARAQTTAAVTPEASKGTQQERETSVGELPRDTGVIVKITK